MSLPTQLSSFVGRDREVAAVAELTAESRLVTLTGPPGIGKSRLALEVARRIEDPTGSGAVWVDLASLTDAGLAPEQVAAALGLREESGRSALAGLGDALRNRDVLLVLDNCEHLVDACARLADHLLGGCPRLRILATSREPLVSPGEQVYQVSALPLPAAVGGGPAGIGASEAVRLFVDRAQAVLPSFRLDDRSATAVAEICRRLDGLPLAIELAAARARVLAPEQIAARLDDAFRLLAGGVRTALPRHRTLRGAIDWSHALLSEREQLMLQRLSIFSGTFSLDAIEAVCTDEVVSAADALELLSALVEKSWVVMEPRAGEARYRLLEVIRQYAAERRSGSAAEMLRGRHADYFLALVEGLEPRLVGFGGTADLSAPLDEETANFRAAAEWLERTPGRGEQAVRLMSSLSWHWFAVGQFSELRQRLTTALELTGPAPTLWRAKGLTALGLAAFGQSDRKALRGPLEEAIAILRRLDAPGPLSFALIGRSVSAALDGDLTEALELLDEALALARTSGLTSLAALALYWRGSMAWSAGDADAGRSALDEAVRLARASGDEAAVCYSCTRAGLMATLQDDGAATEAYFTEALASHHRTKNRWGTVELLIGLAGVLVARRRPEHGARLLGAADAECGAMGVPLRADLERFYRHVTGAAATALGERAFTAESAAGRSLQAEEALALVSVAELLVPTPEPAVVSTVAPPVLRVLALGPLEITCGGARVPDRAWRAARPRELLLYLLCHPGGATRDQLGLVFWPEGAPAQVKNAFHVAMHHLRKALGRPDLVVFERERYRANWGLGIEFDAARFEKEVRAALRDGMPGAGHRLEEALALYRGELLEDAGFGDWHHEYRDRLRQLWIGGQLALGVHLEGEERQQAAAEAYHLVMGADPLHEEACRRLMRLYAKLGQRGQAIHQFERLAGLLKADVDAEPEPATRSLYDRIRTGEPI